MVTSGKIDLECGTTTNTLSRQEKVDFSLPIWVDGATFVVKADSPIKTHADLGGKKIAVMEGTTTERALKRALANSYVNAEVVLVKSHIEGLELVHQGQSRRLRLRQHGAHRSGAGGAPDHAGAVRRSDVLV